MKTSSGYFQCSFGVFLAFNVRQVGTLSNIAVF
jgi:hypothetical protein